MEPGFSFSCNVYVYVMCMYRLYRCSPWASGLYIYAAIGAEVQQQRASRRWMRRGRGLLHLSSFIFIFARSAHAHAFLRVRPHGALSTLLLGPLQSLLAVAALALALPSALESRLALPTSQKGLCSCSVAVVVGRRGSSSAFCL
jgi:hypothetical protein